jgi:starch phosphorylase
MIRLHLDRGRKIEEFAAKWTAQMNDTHPSLGVAELMRLLIDEHDLDWGTAWDITQRTFGFTNHTLLPEALEKWSVGLLGRLLPRHLEIIYEINSRFLDEVRARFPGDTDRLRRVSLIDEAGERYVRMAHLAVVGSHAINGVAALHTKLLETNLLADFYQMWPTRFNNKTNGVTPRRWIAVSDKRLAALLTEAIGPGWLTDLSQLRRLVPLADDPQFRQQWGAALLAVKDDFCSYLESQTGVAVPCRSLLDVMVKRIHEYKRQHLKALQIIALYKRLKRNPRQTFFPQAFLFGGKAAPGYFMAKLIIKLINSVADVVNRDPDIGGLLKVAFFPNFNVTSGQRVYPAADLSEQISLAGKEASGTGNMKFMMNGAVTIGTLDGANIEIREEVGPENFFLFGLTAEEAVALRAQGYHPRDYYERDAELKEVLDSIASGEFSNGDKGLFRPLLDSLLSYDPFLVLADFRSYVDCQDTVNRAFQDQKRWMRMSILNTAHSGKFSSDRSIREYAADIWFTKPVALD